MAAIPAISMYRLQTYYEEMVVPLPKCMYSFPSYFQTNSQMEGVQSQESSTSIQILESRQEDILCQLDGLKAAVEEMASRLGVSLPRPKPKATPSTHDFVISASPTDPPLIISTLQHVMKQRGLDHSTATFVHSSVQGHIQDPVKTRFQNFTSCSKETGRAPVILTIVWKEVGDLPFLVVSPCAHTPLTGEITIARFLCRTLLPDLYGNLTPEELANVDNWIDQSLAGNKERTAALKSLNVKLSKQQWILNDKMTLADVVLACCLVKENGGSSVPANVDKWLKRIPGLLLSN